MLDRLESANEAESLSTNIINNKAAALNILGRYSEAIFILEQNMSHIEKDTSYKNLADSYYSIGMLEKAIGNY
jgi:tetratricopeptide (TPR) repeat protein